MRKKKTENKKQLEKTADRKGREERMVISVHEKRKGQRESFHFLVLVLMDLPNLQVSLFVWYFCHFGNFTVRRVADIRKRICC